MKENPNNADIFPFRPIGMVHNECTDPKDAGNMAERTSIILIDDKYEDALYNIETCEFIDVVFFFHKQEERAPKKDEAHNEAEMAFPLRSKTRSGEISGVFASRSPSRPNPIGITSVRLLRREGNRLEVTGLDAIDGTPVLDIKSPNSSHLENQIHASIQKTKPRLDIQRYIHADDTEKLLLLAGQIHGHYCPGLAMGVMASVCTIKELEKIHQLSDGGEIKPDSVSKADSDGMEGLLAIVETNNCFSDGVQLVTGCSFGNNSLIYHDLGKTAFTLARRDGIGVRIISRPDAQAIIKEAFPDFESLYKRVVVEQQRSETEVAAFKKSGVERAFGTLKIEFDRLFNTEQTEVAIPDYAPSYESKVCAVCGESVMSARTVSKHKFSHSSSNHTNTSETSPDSLSTIQCLKCAKEPFGILDGHGIRCND